MSNNTARGGSRPEYDQLHSEVQNIMNNVVTVSSVTRYTKGIVIFMQVFNNDLLHFLFKDWFLENLNESQAIDESHSTESQRKMHKHMAKMLLLILVPFGTLGQGV